MPALSSFEYAIIRVVPRVERGECLNAGVILYCKARDFLGAGIELDRACLAALSPGTDPDVVQAHLACIPELCAGSGTAGALGRLSRSERFNWLVAPRSTIIQTSPVHAGLTGEPAATLEHLMQKLVRRAPAP